MTDKTREDNPFEDEMMAKEWINAIETEKGGTRENEVYPMISNWVKENNLKKVLEIGAGQGVCSPFIESEYIGVEPSQTLVNRAYELYPGKKFIRGSSYALPLGDESVDGAFSLGVWFHIENLDDTHKELARVVKSNGKVLIITSNPETYDIWESVFSVAKVGKKLDGPVKLPTGKMARNVFFLHTQDEITNSLEKNGFKIENIKMFGRGSKNVKDKGLGIWIAIRAFKI